jgi:hypothetical protein
MRVQLETHKRYRAVVQTTHTTPAGLAMLRTRLLATGFEQIGITPERGRVTIEATYCGVTRQMELDYDITDVRQVA